MDSTITSFGANIEFKLITQIGFDKSLNHELKTNNRYSGLTFDVNSILNTCGIYVIVNSAKKLLCIGTSNQIGNVFERIINDSDFSLYPRGPKLKETIDNLLSKRSFGPIYLYIHETSNIEEANNLYEEMTAFPKIKE